MKKIYIAGSFSNKEEKDQLLKLIEYVRRTNPNAELYIPMEHFVPGGLEMDNSEWAHRVFLADVNAIQHCDEIIALYRGRISGTGTAWEIGYAYGLGKHITVHVPEQVDITSLMVMNSADIVICDKKVEQK